MVKEKSVVKNYGYNLIYQIFLLVVPIVVTPYIARILGDEYSGQYSFTSSIVAYFVLFASLGFGYYAQRLIASHQGDKKQQTIDFWEILIARLIPALIVTAVYIVLALSNVYGEKYKILMLVQTFSIFAVLIDIAYFFQGNEEFGKIVLNNVIIKSVSIACIFIFVRSTEDLWIYVFIQSVTSVLSAVALWVYVPKLICKISFLELHPIKHLSKALILFLPAIATSVYTTLDKILIGIITQNDAENGNYEYAERIVKLSMTIITSLGTVIIPRNSHKWQEGDIEGVRENIYKSSKFVFFLGVPLCLGMISVADCFIPVYLGDGYLKAPILMKILSPLVLIIGLSNVFGLQYLIPSGRDKSFTWAIVSGAIVNIILNSVFIPFLGAYGAAIATVIAEICVTTIMAVLIRKDINFGEIIASGWKYMLSGIVMFIPCFLLGIYLSPTLLNVVIIVLSGIVIYFCMLLLLKDDILFLVFKKLSMKKKEMEGKQIETEQDEEKIEKNDEK